MTRVLAVVAHPDDETLMCGATLARHAGAGDGVSVLTFTDGVSSRHGRGWADTAGEIWDRRENFGRALAALGVQFEIAADRDLGDTWRREDLLDRTGCGWRHEDFVDQELDRVSIRALAGTTAYWIARFRADVVYTHWPGDLNADHRAVAEAVLVATRPAVSPVRAVYAGETPSASEWNFGGPAFAPNVFVDCTETIGLKLKALACYGESEVPAEKHPRAVHSVEALARWRGNTVGVEFAEAFVPLRVVVGFDGGIRL